MSKDLPNTTAWGDVIPVLPTGAAERKAIPLCTGVVDYFPLALAAVAELSRIGNAQHNGEGPPWWNRSKSTDHADTILRHMIDRGTMDSDGIRHSAKVAWRALAMLQQELEDAGGKPGRASRWPDREPPKGVPAAGDVQYVADIKTGPMAPSGLKKCDNPACSICGDW